MRVAREWWLRCALAAVAAIAAVALFRLAGSALDTASYEDCDNLAGECLRIRQQDALRAIGWASILLALTCIWVVASAFWRRTRRWHPIVVCVAVILLAGTAATDPTHHLDNRYHGWLSDRSGV
jgi:ABC-type Fe3+-siderophore transport system permease subunit